MTLPSLDKNAALQRLGGDESLWLDIVEVFLIDMPAQLSALEQVVSNKDLEGSKRRAHAMKSAAANIGASLMSDIALQLENKSLERDLESVINLSNQIRDEFNRVSELLSSNP